MFSFKNTYIELPSIFYARVKPSQFPSSKLILYNQDLAHELGLSPDLAHESDIFVGNRLSDGSDPIAQAYAGHQFGHFNILGDGRAILLGEHITPKAQKFDIQLKGAGQTPYSRRGDGRAALGPMLREYIISEAMHALKVPTTRSLAVALTGENISREDILPGAVLTRIAKSHVRVGTFQFAYIQENINELKSLADYMIDHFYPEVRQKDEPYLEFLKAVIHQQAKLIAQWMSLGFIHGVMNTDNMSIVGETIDYGPCAFMNDYNINTVYSSIDRQGRYAYGNQPQIAQWNLSILAQSLLPLIDQDEATAVIKAKSAINEFSEIYEKHRVSILLKKLGLETQNSTNLKIADEFLNLMAKYKADFTNTFSELSRTENLSSDFFKNPEVANWLNNWKKAIGENDSFVVAQKRMQQINPSIIPRNHIVDSVLKLAENGDYSKLHKLIEELKQPYKNRNLDSEFCLPPKHGEDIEATFCGT